MTASNIMLQVCAILMLACAWYLNFHPFFYGVVIFAWGLASGVQLFAYAIGKGWTIYERKPHD